MAWLIHKTQAITGSSGSNATSWDLRSLAMPGFLSWLLITVVVFFGIGFWLDCRFLRTASTQRRS